MVTIVEMKNPRIIFEALAVRPMTKWELKQETKLEYPRVHEAISLLESEHYVKVLDTVPSKKGREMKIYGLTFKGVIAYLERFSLRHPDLLVPLSAEETLEEYQAKREKDKEEYRKKLEQLAQFLETQGKLLDYPLFKETRWLAEHYGDAFFDDVLDIARLIGALQPFPSGAKQLLNQLQKQVDELKKEKWMLLRDPEAKRKIRVTVAEDGKLAETDHFDPLENINEELEESEKQLETLHVQEDKWWRMGFAMRFAERFQHLKGKGNMHNMVLHKFFREVADFYRRLEVEPSENMAKIFESPSG
ncbi:MAG: hypothetical protein NWE99_04775 [Candidatus Bathyarchaeota archaeon]|nr:hypothetical protein [Candidatus Bathyarchaeota archaeon]